jgi:hypothetical protein
MGFSGARSIALHWKYPYRCKRLPGIQNWRRALNAWSVVSAQTVNATSSNRCFRSYSSQKTDLLGGAQFDLIRTRFSLNRHRRTDWAS